MNNILDEEYVKKKKKKRGDAFHVLLIMLISGCIIATFFSWWYVESIVFSSPIMSIIGFLFIYITMKEKNRVGTLLGLIPATATLFWLVMINVFELSPKDCEMMIPVFLSGGSIVVLVNGVYMISSRYTNHP